MVNPPSENSYNKLVKISGELDYEHTARGRKEQGYLRKFLFGRSEVAACALCGRRLPTSLMVAAHIKPRSECSRKERLDAANIVFAVCLLGCDALYERGLISVDCSGKIRIATQFGSSVLTKTLRTYHSTKSPAWKEENAKYFGWHFDQRFQG